MRNGKLFSTGTTQYLKFRKVSLTHLEDTEKVNIVSYDFGDHAFKTAKGYQRKAYLFQNAILK